MMHDRLASSTGHLLTSHTHWTDILCGGILWCFRYLLASPLECTFQFGPLYHPASAINDQMSTSRCPQTIFSVETLPSRHHSPPFASNRLQLIHYALGDGAMSPSHQPTGNYSIMTQSLPLLPTAIESSLIPPPTLPEGTSYPSSAPVVPHSSLPLSSFLIRNGSSDRNMLDKQQLRL